VTTIKVWLLVWTRSGMEDYVHTFGGAKHQSANLSPRHPALEMRLTG
jgi:hypothetical protein